MREMPDYIENMENMMTKGEKARIGEIYAPQVVCTPPANAWMDMTAMPDGEIRCYGKQNGRRVYFSSCDAGLSWKICDVDDPTAMCSALKSPYSNRWIQSYYVEGEGGYQNSEMPTPPSDKSGWQAVVSEEGPGGRVWWVKICDDNVRCPRYPLALRKRRRILITANLQTWPTSPIVARTDDEGETWQVARLKGAPLHEASWPHQGVRWQNGSCEASILEREDGSLLMFARTSQDYHYQYESFDGGETWTDPKPSALHGTLTMPTLLKLSNGASLCFFCNTQPLPEENHLAAKPPLNESERLGRSEDVFTNRDANHAAVSLDEGKTWKGLRELHLNTIRNASDFRTCGGNLGSLDKSVHQFQALELPLGKVLLMYGQHAYSRGMLIFDPMWLLEKEKEENFQMGLIHVSTQVYLKSVFGNLRTAAGHCAWNRMPGAVLMPDPDENYEEAVFIRANADKRLFSPQQGLVWNFPAAKCGEVCVRMRPGEEEITLTLADRWFNPCDSLVGAFSPFQVKVSDAVCPKGQWSELIIRWNEEYAECTLNCEPFLKIKAACAAPNGLCYLVIQSAQYPSEKTGGYVKKLTMRSLDE